MKSDLVFMFIIYQGIQNEITYTTFVLGLSTYSLVPKWLFLM